LHSVKIKLKLIKEKSVIRSRIWHSIKNIWRIDIKDSHNRIFPSRRNKTWSSKCITRHQHQSHQHQKRNLFHLPPHYDYSMTLAFQFSHRIERIMPNHKNNILPNNYKNFDTKADPTIIAKSDFVGQNLLTQLPRKHTLK